MTTLQAVGLQRRTVNIMSKFFEDIKKLDQNDLSTYQMMLYDRVKYFFDDMNRLSEQEFAEFLKKHQFKNTDPAQYQKYTDAFNCLVAFIVAEYSESDLLRYFLPEKYSTEAKPSLDSSSWRIVYWAKFLTYWLGSKLFNRQKFNMNEEQEALNLAINTIKQAMSESNYLDLHQNSAFNENLEIVVGKFVENRHSVLNNSLEDSGSVIGEPLPFLQKNETSESAASSSSYNQVTTSSEEKKEPVVPPPPPLPMNISKGDLIKDIVQIVKENKQKNESGKSSGPNSSNGIDFMRALKNALDIRRAAIKSDEKLDDQNTNDYESTDEWDGKPSNVIFHIVDANENTGEDQVDGLSPKVNCVFMFEELNDEKLGIFKNRLNDLLPDGSESISLVTIVNNIVIAFETLTKLTEINVTDLQNQKAESQDSQNANTIGRFFRGFFNTTKTDKNNLPPITDGFTLR